MVAFVDSSRPRDLIFILIFQMSIWGSDSFLVIGPSEPIVAILGADTVLPCRVSPAMSVENMELRWFRSQFNEAVYVYQNGMEQTEEQVVDFKGRTELVKDFITEGRVAVRIRSLRVSDNGMYTCFFKRGSDFEEAILELKVIGLGSGPYVSMVGPEDGGIRLACKGKGWFPQPEIQWKDSRGEKIASLSEAETQDNDGLFQVEASLIVRDSSKRDISCFLKNPFFGQEKVETISIPEPFFPRTSPLKVPLVVVCLVLATSLGANVFLAWKNQQERKKAQKFKKEKESEIQDKESLKKDLDSRKKLYQQDWRKAQLYADWRKEQFTEVTVTLDPDTSHPNLNLSESKKHVSIKSGPQSLGNSTSQDQGDYENIPTVLGQNCFNEGKYYWEVKINMGEAAGPVTKWALGICSEMAKRVGWFVECPEKLFWAVEYKGGEIRALTAQQESLSLRQLPHRIGIFLDWDGGDLSFYNMVDGSHIYSFTGIILCGKLRPYFRLQGAGTSLTCLTSDDDDKTHPDCSLKTSVTHFRSYDMGVSQETSTLLPPKTPSASISASA
ncbi:butyrophilin subfamily 1 member A1-like [Erinaceus europaeus]|uniref:Butyrophilin subfamily 1 member A1-like n=1 Tax=Erinaceus europaeus TaxID=9365 RepID=A0A1S3A0N4_ERIEU|nr:butyrophilin subfamily 1 member A1-like [Erinaceus europaeus]